MHKLFTTFILIAGFALPALASAQTACPSSNRLGFFPQGGAALDLSSGAFRIYVGRADTRGGSNKTLQAIVMRSDGSCVGGFYVGIGGAEQRLSRNSNICLGNSDDRIEIMRETRNISCGPNSPGQPLDAFDYGGFNLSIYGGGGNDYLTGGNGQDIIYGGTGNDTILSMPGTNDRAYGENNNDIIFASTGSATTSSGGADTDTIVDRQGVSDTLDGGPGNDTLDSGCHVSTISCSTGTDTVHYPDARPFWLLSCENWNDLSC